MINNPTGREKVLPAVFLFLLPLWIFFHFFMLPGYREYREARNEMQDVKNSRKIENTGDSAINREAALLGKARADWEELKTRYAGSGRQDTLIAHLGKLAREHNLTVHGIGCGRISTIDGIIVQPMEIKFKGRYDDVLAVSGELEKGNYCLEVKSVKFEQPEGNIQDNVENNNSISSPAENPEVIDSLNIMEAPVAAGLLINVYFLPDE
ncbi:hypothetical protein DCCM_4518 [Desulfocucumis palustris]|uniref:Type IV pilus biogenesis protein PilO n=1 Tax=Desulfocucumis palustris TaxID=1898651 RepID=A0A2L2XGS3_9FIRM|nr:hypothetical protein [Desulfocucumis palustris]GBF35395.1 hypothetical protein DCCM_4518 [Desulfocucumis palustris]